MAVRPRKEVEAALKRKGFRQDEGDHHWFVYWTADGLKTAVRTKTSHGTTKDLGDGLISQMARQLKLSKADFLQLVDCTLNQEAYEQSLSQSNDI